MSKQFKGYKSKAPNTNNTYGNQITEEQALNMMSQYNGRSPEDIKNELFEQYRKRVKEGNLTHEQLKSTIDNAKNLFTPEQICKLSILLDELKNIK